MANFSITTSAREDEALAQTLVTTNERRVAAGFAPFASVAEMVTTEFHERLKPALLLLRQVEGPTVAEAFDRASATDRGRVRTILGI